MPQAEVNTKDKSESHRGTYKKVTIAGKKYMAQVADDKYPADYIRILPNGKVRVNLHRGYSTRSRVKLT
jgi:hypothetical protein